MSIPAAPITVEIPGTLRRFTANRARVEVAPNEAQNLSVAEVLRCAAQQYPQLGGSLFTSDGRVFAYVGVFVNRQDVRQLCNEATPVRAGDTVTLLPAVAGG